MEKMVKLIALVLTGLIVLSVGVLALGESTVGGNANENGQENANGNSAVNDVLDDTRNSVGNTQTDTDTTTTDTTDDSTTDNNDDSALTDEGTQEGPNAAARIAAIQARRAALSVCDSSEELKQRIKCRLEAKRDNPINEEGYEEEESDENSIPEECRRLGDAGGVEITSKEDCRRFYNNIRPCYDKTGRAKIACFRRVSGLGTAAISGQTDKKKELRDYVVSLLYDLQRKIEDAVDNERIDTEVAAEAINLIVQIKEKLLDGSPRDEIKPLLEELRSKLQELRGLIQ